jgi:hypothetical protein
MRLEVVSAGRHNVRREAAPFRTGLLSARILHDLAEIMVLLGHKHYQSTNLDGLDSTSRLRIRQRATAAFRSPDKFLSVSKNCLVHRGDRYITRNRTTLRDDLIPPETENEYSPGVRHCTGRLIP